MDSDNDADDYIYDGDYDAGGNYDGNFVDFHGGDDDGNSFNGNDASGYDFVGGNRDASEYGLIPHSVDDGDHRYVEGNHENETHDISDRYWNVSDRYVPDRRYYGDYGYDGDRNNYMCPSNHVDDIPRQMEKAYVEFDGASKGNPGRAGAGAVIKSKDGTVLARVQKGLGRDTNNAAEYEGFLEGMRTARDMGYERIHVKGDSKLVHNQVSGEWQARSERMASYRNEAWDLMNQFKESKISHIPRGSNRDADSEANRAVNLPAGYVQKEDGSRPFRGYRGYY